MYELPSTGPRVSLPWANERLEIVLDEPTLRGGEDVEAVLAEGCIASTDLLTEGAADSDQDWSVAERVGQAPTPGGSEPRWAAPARVHGRRSWAQERLDFDDEVTLAGVQHAEEMSDNIVIFLRDVT